VLMAGATSLYFHPGASTVPGALAALGLFKLIWPVVVGIGVVIGLIFGPFVAVLGLGQSILIAVCLILGWWLKRRFLP
jgi:hypothetical protein